MSDSSSSKLSTTDSQRKLDLALANARQNIQLLLSQARANRIDPRYLEQRLAALGELLGQLAEDRRDSGQQQRLAALYEVSRVIGSSLDLQTVLNQVMDAIIKLTGAERGFLMLLDDDGNLTPKATRAIDEEELNSGEFFISRTVTQQVLETGQAVLTTNAQEDPRFATQASVVAHALRSIMATPLRVRGQVTGVVYVDNRARTGLFVQEDLAMLDAFAAQAAVAIDNARLFSETDLALRDRVEELLQLRRVDLELNQAINNAGSVTHVTLGWAARMAGATSGALGLVAREDGRASSVQIVACYDCESLPDSIHDAAVLPLTDYPDLAWVVNRGEPQATQRDGRHLLSVPILLESRTLGVIILASESPFDENERELVTRMAARAAISIQNMQLFDAVRAADRAKSEYVGVVAHELKVPMTSIQGYADLLKGEHAGPVNDQQKRFLDTIKNSVERMRILVNDLSDISRIESGHLRIHLEPLDPHEMIQAAIESAATQIEKRGHRLVQLIEHDLPPVVSDKYRLTQVLLNLLSNAYKYTPDGGAITIRAWHESGVVRFAVRDTGVGMSKEELARLGTKFWRADNPHVLSQQGTGLGFAITRQLITLMRGDLEIESEPGVGSTFSFTMQVAQPQPAQTLPAPAAG